MPSGVVRSELFPEFLLFRRRSRWWVTAGLVVLLELLLALTLRAQWQTQGVLLQPGWNAIHLSVQPEPRDCDAVFAGTAVESVWRWNRRFSSVQFTVDPQEPLPENPDWQMWLPPTNPRAFLNRLAALHGNETYLVKLPTNAAPVTLGIKGRVVLPQPRWNPHSINLVGFPVLPGNPPTFADFLRYTPEVDTSLGLANELFRIDHQARSVRIVQPSRDRIQAGTAYWIACARAPAVVSALHVVPPGGSLAYGSDLVELDLRLRNVHPSEPMALQYRLVNSETPAASVAGSFPELAGPVPLSELVPGPDGRGRWSNLQVSNALVLARGEERVLRLGLRRADLASYAPRGTNGAQYQSILQVMDVAKGILVQVPVTASQPWTNLYPPVTGTGTNGSLPARHRYEGLWVGNVGLRGVNAPAYTTNVLNTPNPLTIRLLVHVDGTGTARLLQQVVLAWDPNLNAPPSTNGTYALWADESGVPANARQVNRIGSAAFPTMAPLLLRGVFGRELVGTIHLGPFDRSNPFLHQYHPMHDNKDAAFQPYDRPVEVPALARSLSLGFSTSTNAATGLRAGVDELEGQYEESITGLRSQPVVMRGPFALRRISRINTLNGIPAN